MTEHSILTKNPNRVRAGCVNRAFWRGFMPTGLERLRQTAKANQPWLKSTGPRTEAGKAVSALNGRVRQKGMKSVRELRAEVADIGDLIAALRGLRTGGSEAPGSR